MEIDEFVLKLINAGASHKIAPMLSALFFFAKKIETKHVYKKSPLYNIYYNKHTGKTNIETKDAKDFKIIQSNLPRP